MNHQRAQKTEQGTIRIIFDKTTMCDEEKHTIWAEGAFPTSLANCPSTPPCCRLYNSKFIMIQVTWLVYPFAL